MIWSAHPKLICFGFGNKKKFFDLMVSYGKGSDNTAKGSRKIAQSIVESNVILGGAVNKTLICAEKNLSE